MKLGVIQSNYIPWRGYFDFINSVDTFVIYDDVQFSKGSWRHRNMLKYGNSTKWITLPIKVNLGMKINEVTVKNSLNWKSEHFDLISASLSTAPYFSDAIEVWKKGIDVDSDLLTDLNESLIRAVCNYLGIQTPIVRSEQYNLSGTKTERLMELFKKTGCTSYLSGPAATYLDVAQFRQNNIGLEYKTYQYPHYPQAQGGEFIGGVSILDLIANTGKMAIELCRCLEPNSVVV
jgi:hypothetical protein